MSTEGLRMVWLIVTAMVALGLSGVPSRAQPEEVEHAAWSLWRSGLVVEAGESAARGLEQSPDDASLRQLSALIAFVTGHYEQGLAHFAQLEEGSDLAKGLHDLVVDAYVRLHRPAEAAQVAQDLGLGHARVSWLKERAERPLEVTLAETIELPFATGGPVGELLPAVAIELEGQRLLGHLDTGGTYIVTSPKVGKSLGIATERIGRGYANNRETDVLGGIARELRLGDAVLRNVPVTVVDALSGPLEELVILGNNILELFVVTWDGPGKKLILSPTDSQSSRAHLAAVPDGATELDFFLYSDHFAFARGMVGDYDAVLFVDTGLAAIDPNGRQVAMGAPASALADWGMSANVEPGQFVAVPGELRLGPLTQAGHSIYVFPSENDRNWHGLRVPGVLSGGFLKRYSWTMDFKRRKWYFVDPSEPDSPEESEKPTQFESGSGDPEDDAGALAAYVGSYEVAPGVALEISRADGRLRIQAPGQQPVPLQADGGDAFSIPLAGAQVTFERDSQGGVTGLVLTQAGNETHATRRPGL